MVRNKPQDLGVIPKVTDEQKRDAAHNAASYCVRKTDDPVPALEDLLYKLGILEPPLEEDDD